MAFLCQHNQKSLPKKKKEFFSYRCSAIFYILLYSELMYTDVNLRAAGFRVERLRYGDGGGRCRSPPAREKSRWRQSRRPSRRCCLLRMEPKRNRSHSKNEQKEKFSLLFLAFFVAVWGWFVFSQHPKRPRGASPTRVVKQNLINKLKHPLKPEGSMYT